MGSFSVMHSFSQNLIRAKQYRYKGKLEKKATSEQVIEFPCINITCMNIFNIPSE